MNVTDTSNRLLYLEPSADRWQVKAGLRKLIEFRVANLLQPVPNNTTFELILCRNVLIYFEEAERLLTLSRLAGCLANHGYLILGAAESTSRLPVSLRQDGLGKTIVYRKV